MPACEGCGAPTRAKKLKARLCESCRALSRRGTIEASKEWIRQYARTWFGGECTLVEQARALLHGPVTPADGPVVSYYRLRHQAIVAYGGYRCRCCGTTEPLFLTIDHIAGGGNRHRRQLNSGTIYRWLRDHGYPAGYQVLCINCNLGRHLNGGECPHRDAERQG